jgi:MFS family permease
MSQGNRFHIRQPDWYAGNVPWLFATKAVRSLSQASLVISVPLYVAAAGYSTPQAGYLLSIALAGCIGMTILVGFISDRYGRKSMLMAIAGLAGNSSPIYITLLTNSSYPPKDNKYGSILCLS